MSLWLIIATAVGAVLFLLGMAVGSYCNEIGRRGGLLPEETYRQFVDPDDWFQAS